jgi:predicted MPP superfamily phosphohydrolase
MTLRAIWRRRLGRVLIVWIVVALAVLLYGMAFEPRRLVLRDYPLVPPGWPASCDGLRIDHVTDIHTGSPGNGLDNLDRIVAHLAASDSDAVVLTGDYVILSVLGGRYIPADRVAPHLRALSARKPVFAVLGNHDWWKDGLAVRRALESAGIVVLEDEARRVRLRECDAWMVGIGDLWTAPHNVRRAMRRPSCSPITPRCGRRCRRVRRSCWPGIRMAGRSRCRESDSPRSGASPRTATSVAPTPRADACCSYPPASAPASCRCASGFHRRSRG